jgi:predicted RND superfamily exporter protein
VAISSAHPPRSIAFGIDRIGLFALARPRLTAIAMMLIAIGGVYGLLNLSIDRDLRSLFRGETEIYQSYVEALEAYVDPENQLLVLIEGEAIGDPDVLTELRDLHLELSLLPDVGNVFSPFSLREPPDDDGATRPLIADTAAGLDGRLIAHIREHPILGSTVLSEDGAAMVFVVTHAEQRAPLEQHDALIAEVDETLGAMLGDAPVQATVAGFSPIRAEIVRMLKRDQIVLNGSGMLIGFLMSLILFRSLTAAAVTAIPAVFAGLSLLGWTGSLGLEITILSGVVPALVMVLGFADGMHLTTAWRRYRLEGHSVLEAERLALIEAGPACMLTALTTAVAFLSMIISDVAIVRDFGRIGAIGTVLATAVVLVGHGLMVRLIGRFWSAGSDSAFALISRMSAPVAAITTFVTNRAWLVVAAAIPITLALGAAYFAVPPEHSLSETLPADSPMVEALGVIDSKLGGAFPVQIIVPVGADGVDTPEALARIRSVHEAIDGLGARRPASLWSLAEWVDGDVSAALDILADLPAETRQAFVAGPGALVTINLAEQPTAEMAAAIDEIEAAAEAAVPDVVVTGATVVGARESTRTIGQLNRSLGIAVVVALALVAVAIRSVGAGLVAALPNLLPIVAVGTILWLLDTGMQLTSVVSLTVAFGIAIDDTIHYLNVFFLTPGTDIKQRLVDAARRVGPVLVATTIVLVGGMLMTQTSGLATVVLYGLLAMGSLVFALIGDLFFLPAIIAGPARRLFAKRQDPSVQAEIKAAE